MEPITLAIAALTIVAGGITAGATNKIGEGLGEGLVTAAQQWLAQLRQHSPETVKRLAAVSDPNVIDVEILEEVKQVAAAHPDVQAAMNKTAMAAVADSGQFPNLTKLADKIANVNFGTIKNQNIYF
ncbi:hypothetical protein BH23CYA1_BH23CYA1_08820 [soil metagenome]